MPRRTAIAAVSGLAAGIALTTAAVDGITVGDLPDVVTEIAITVCPMMAVTVVALAALRHWMAAHGEGQRKQLLDLQAYREGMAEEMDRRSRELARREEALARHTNLTQQQYRTLIDQLHEARSARDEATRERDRLQEDFDVLADQYNGLVLGEMDERSALFSPRRPRTGTVRDRRRERSITPEVPRLGVIARQPQPEPQHHARPAEG